MKRMLMMLTGLLLCGSAAASINLPDAPELNVEISPGALYNKNSNLILLGYTESAPAFLGRKSYHQFNVGAWDGPVGASIIGMAKGVQWDRGNGSFIRLSTGASLISETSYRLSTAFQFYEQFMVQKNLGRLSYAISYRHWSNAFLKRPNRGMDFLGGRLEYRWY